MADGARRRVRGDGAEPADRGGGAQPAHLVVGHVTKPHGTRGEVFVWPLTDTPDALFAEGETVLLGDEQGALGEPPETVTVERVRGFKRGLLIKFEGLEDRDAVEPLAQRYLLIPFERSAPLEPDEVYYHELLGLEVVTEEGEVVGRIREVFEAEPADLLEVTADDRLRLVPFSRRLVRRVDVEAGRVVIRPPPGLLDI